ncbi:MAG TPA: TetR/AcrR family transcriptional regulator [Steroidobacteraceae bacterium]
MDTESALRKTLIAAALKILKAEKEEPSLRAVARAAGVSAMAPYRHFKDKMALLAAVADQGFEGLRRTLAAADVQSDSREALFAQGMAFLDFARKNPALFRLMYSPDYGNATTEAVRGTYEVLANRIAGIVSKDVAAATLACRSLVQGMATIELSGRLIPARREDIVIALRLFVRGLGPGT